MQVQNSNVKEVNSEGIYATEVNKMKFHLTNISISHDF